MGIFSKNKKEVSVGWIDWDHIAVGEPTRVLPLTHIKTKTSDPRFLRKTATTRVTSFDRGTGLVETVTSVYVYQKVPYLKALINNELPLLTDRVEIGNLITANALV